MKTAIILHGTLGSPDGNWLQWLKTELEDTGLQVWLPALPNAEQPSLREWDDYVHKECPFAIDGETLIVGHSSGAILALILAQQNQKPIGSIVCISAFHDNSLRWRPNSKLFDVPFDWAAIRANANKLLFIHSDNDPYVPLDRAQLVADKCQAELVVIPGQGHFNLEQSEAYREFPKLLEVLWHHKRASRMNTIVLISHPELWQQAQAAGGYNHSTLDKTLDEVGFIHASFPSQTMAVVERHFADRPEVLLLLVDEDKVIASVKHEAPLSGSGGIYPHIYGALNVDAVYKTVLLQKDEAGQFIPPDELKNIAKD